jgi:hypothetical protein
MKICPPSHGRDWNRRVTSHEDAWGVANTRSMRRWIAGRCACNKPRNTIFRKGMPRTFPFELDTSMSKQNRWLYSGREPAMLKSVVHGQLKALKHKVVAVQRSRLSMRVHVLEAGEGRRTDGGGHRHCRARASHRCPAHRAAG